MCPNTTVRQSNRGFSLVEFILAMFIVAVVAGGASLFAVYFFNSYSFSFNANQNVNQAQTGMTTLIREIREARSGDNGAWPLIDAADNSFIFYSDVDNDGRTDRVRYFINGTALQKGVIPPTQVPVTYPAGNEVFSTIASSIDTSSGPLFTYYNGNWPSDAVNNPLPANQRIANTRYVGINLQINVASGSGSTAQPFQLTSGVQIRSLKNNL